MADVTIKACDRCQAQPATEYVAGAKGQPMRSIDLCEECAHQFRDFIKTGRPAKPPRPSRGTIVKSKHDDD